MGRWRGSRDLGRSGVGSRIVLLGRGGVGGTAGGTWTLSTRRSSRLWRLTITWIVLVNMVDFIKQVAKRTVYRGGARLIATKVLWGARRAWRALGTPQLWWHAMTLGRLLWRRG